MIQNFTAFEFCGLNYQAALLIEAIDPIFFEVCGSNYASNNDANDPVAGHQFAMHCERRGTPPRIVNPVRDVQYSGTFNFEASAS